MYIRPSLIYLKETERSIQGGSYFASNLEVCRVHIIATNIL